MKRDNKNSVWFRLLNEVTYFIPDGMLALTIVSLFFDLGKNGFVITIALGIAYLGLLYGERFFHRLIIAREMVDDIVDGVEEMALAMKTADQQFVTLDGLICFAEILESDFDNKINELRKELEGDGVVDQMVKAQQHKSQRR